MPPHELGLWPRRIVTTRWTVLVVLAVVVGLVVVLATRPPGAAAVAADPPAPRLSGRLVAFALNSYQPDGDPIDRVVVAAQLHDPDPAPHALPDTTLVLSMYLENFRRSTTPILPDLLRADQIAISLGGFMQGKAALVDGVGRVRYRGGVLAEAFLDNTVHLIVDLDRPERLPGAASLRLTGAFTLYTDRTLVGTLRAARPLAPAEVAALRVAHPRPVSWQHIVSGLAVHVPTMMGTASSPPAQPVARASRRQPVAPAPPPAAPLRPWAPVLRGVGAALVIAALIAALIPLAVTRR